MSIQPETRFLATLDTPNLPANQKAGIAVYERSDPMRLFAWIVGKTVDIRIGSKVITVNTESLEKFVDRHKADPNMPKEANLSTVQKFQNYLNRDENAARTAAMDIGAPAGVELNKFRVETSNVFTGPSMVFADTIKALKSLPTEISTGVKGFASEIVKATTQLHGDVQSGKVRKNIEQFVHDAGKKLENKLESPLNTMKKTAENAEDRFRKFVTPLENSIRNMFKSSKATPPSEGSETTVTRTELHLPPEEKTTKKK